MPASGFEAESSNSQVIFEPSEEEILAELVPLYVSNGGVRGRLESVASEQGARRARASRCMFAANPTVPVPSDPNFSASHKR